MDITVLFRNGFINVALDLANDTSDEIAMLAIDTLLDDCYMIACNYA